MDKKFQLRIKFADCTQDSVKVLQILRDASVRFNLFDNTRTSVVPNTLISLVEREHYGFGLGSRVIDECIIIDFNPRKDPPQVFGDIVTYIKKRIAHSFPQGMSECEEGAIEYSPV